MKLSDRQRRRCGRVEVVSACYARLPAFSPKTTCMGMYSHAWSQVESALQRVSVLRLLPPRPPPFPISRRNSRLLATVFSNSRLQIVDGLQEIANHNCKQNDIADRPQETQLQGAPARRVQGRPRTPSTPASATATHPKCCDERAHHDSHCDKERTDDRPEWATAASTDGAGRPEVEGHRTSGKRR